MIGVWRIRFRGPKFEFQDLGQRLSLVQESVSRKGMRSRHCAAFYR